MIPLNIPPVCQAEGCKHGSSILSKQGDNIKYMKTCRRHSYKDIPVEKERTRNNK